MGVMKGIVSKSLPYREPHVRGSGGENLGEGWHTTPRGRGPSSAVHVESWDRSPRRIGPVRRRMHRTRRTTTSGLGPPPPPPVRMAYPYVRPDVQGGFVFLGPMELEECNKQLSHARATQTNRSGDMPSLLATKWRIHRKV